MDLASLNIALKLTSRRDRCKLKKLTRKVENNEFTPTYHVSILQFFTSISNIRVIKNFLRYLNIGTKKISCTLKVSDVGDYYVYSLCLDSDYLNDIHKIVFDRFEKSFKNPDKRFELDFMENKRYIPLFDLIKDQPYSFNPHITIGISKTYTDIKDINFTFDIKRTKLDLFKTEDFGSISEVTDALFVCHRINSSNELELIDRNYGIEVDIRDHNENIVLAHDPFNTGESIEHFFDRYNHQLAILNIKSERIEFKIIEEMNKKNIRNYFFLDSSFPMIHTLSKLGIKNNAIRVSEYECIDTALKSANLAEWVWIDCFTRFPLNKKSFKKLKRSGFKICIVSPELQGFGVEKIKEFKRLIDKEKIKPDAICAKLYNFRYWI